jgi:copper chaperone
VTETYQVTGMTCGHCVASVTEELSELPAVTQVEIALNPGGSSTVTVHSTETLTTDEVRAAITEAGYELVTR